ncbi:flagellar biosynthetic protein FliQ [Pseudomonas nitritireducens]|uniref:Flagellar biosynthetic protein FliQ n=1 Tax=Pseudomonas nitroreducens TaxID=46680 RepID=A0A7W7P1Z8_PSENT|nr:flagellar biosynthetic protein FliQ [Pseudomonas nitritireducens]MBB4865388.1 flagellar biosynthetic protein FliQ [Pseudomonas nitritireducens]
MVMSLMNGGIVVAVKLAAPALAVILVVGLLVSMLQSATQINEMTLSFIPKLVCLLIVLVVCGHYLIGTMVTYMRELYMSLPSMIGG